MTDSIPFGQWEKRWHPLRQEWVVYAAHRNNRPWNFGLAAQSDPAPAYDPGCYLCPGNTRVSGLRNPDPYEVFVFENDHPVVGQHAPEIPEVYRASHAGLYLRAAATGIAKVVCYDPRHNVALNEVSSRQITRVFQTLRQEMLEFEADPGIKSVLIFENKGEIVGVSNPHPHCQIYATDFIFNAVRQELRAVESYRQEKQANLFEDIIAAEEKEECRIIASNEHAIAFIPFFARFAYETYIFPRKRHASLITMSDAELAGLANVFQTATRKMDANFNMSFPYILAFAQAPVDGKEYPDYHLHLHLSPPLRQPGLRKFLAGPETGADTFMADTMPEDKAAELRRIVLPPIE